jgi:hypothetical protein
VWVLILVTILGIVESGPSVLEPHKHCYWGEVPKVIASYAFLHGFEIMC